MSNQRKRILIADSFHATQDVVENHENYEYYDFKFIRDGESCLQTIEEFKPHLIVLELFLPKLHGIEVLKWIKSHERFSKIGVITMTYELMLQNYRAALESGADYFFEKPFKPSALFNLFERYFTGKLEIEPFKGEPTTDMGNDSYYDPTIDESPKAFLKFWGTRGSISVAGEKYVRMGGNTPCLEIRDGKNLVIIDSGTGIRPLGEALLDENKHNNFDILISHTHQDHVLGFPFFYPLYSEKMNVNVWSPVGFEKTTESLFNDMLAYSFFPIRLDQMRAEVNFRDLHDSVQYNFGAIKISCHYTYHPGPTLGFKIDVRGHKIGYITDNEFLVGYHGHPKDVPNKDSMMQNFSSLVDFLYDCETVVHEAQYFPREYEQKVGWGHSSITNASILFKFLPSCKHWIVVHHDPKHTDHVLAIKKELHRQILQECGVNILLTYAYDGMVLPISFK